MFFALERDATSSQLHFYGGGHSSCGKLKQLKKEKEHKDLHIGLATAGCDELLSQTNKFHIRMSTMSLFCNNCCHKVYSKQKQQNNKEVNEIRK